MSLSIHDIFDWLKKLGIDVSAPLTWQPSYEPQSYIEWTDNNGESRKLPVNIEDRVTLETAIHLQKLYCPNGTVVEEPILDAGGPFSVVPTERALKFTNGTINGGKLAQVYSHAYPLDPITADRVCKEIIKARGLV